MTTPIPILTAALMAVPGLAAQEVAPARFADMVADGTVEAATLFDRGCPSESEWSSSALAAVEERATTDLDTRTSLAKAITARIVDCPEADRNRAEEWIVGWVNREHNDPDSWYFHDHDIGMVEDSDAEFAEAFGATAALIDAMSPFATQDRVQTMARRIGCDTRLPLLVRARANGQLTTDRLAFVAGPAPPKGPRMIITLPVIQLETGTPKCKGFEPPSGPKK